MVNNDYDCAADLLGRQGLLRAPNFDAKGTIVEVISSVPDDFAAGQIVFKCDDGPLIVADLSVFFVESFYG